MLYLIEMDDEIIYVNAKMIGTLLSFASGWRALAWLKLDIRRIWICVNAVFVQKKERVLIR
jgi:Holliday junction resolvase